MLYLSDYQSKAVSVAISSGASVDVPQWLYEVELEAFRRARLWTMVKSTTLTLTADQELHILDGRVDGRALIKFSNTTRDDHMFLVDLAVLLWSDPTPTEGGDPSLVACEGVSRVMAQPTTAAGSKLSFATDASGDEGKKITVSGYDSAGVWQVEEVTLDATDSTTAVESSVTYNDGQVEDIVKQETFTNKLTVTADAAATTVLVLAPNELSFEAPIVRLKDVPDNADSIKYYFYQKPRKLTDSHQRPMLPEDFQWKIGMNGVLELAHLAEKDFEQATYYRNLKEQGIQEMIDWATPGGVKIKQKGRRRRGLRFDYDANDSHGTP